MPESNGHVRIDRLSVFVSRAAGKFEIDGETYEIPYFIDLPVSQIVAYEAKAQVDRPALAQHVDDAVAQLAGLIPADKAEAMRTVLEVLALNASGYGRTSIEQTEVAWQQLKILCPSLPDALKDRLPLQFIYNQLARRFGDAPAVPRQGETETTVEATSSTASTTGSPTTGASTEPANRKR